MKQYRHFLLAVLVLACTVHTAHAQFTYTISSGEVAITGYDGPGGEVVIPDTIEGLPVTFIGSAAFASQTVLTSITLPNSVTSIGSHAFQECTSLTAITVNPLNPAYSSVDGVLFDKSQSDLIQCPGGKAGSYKIPDGVYSTWAFAFDHCVNLISVTIPESVFGLGLWLSRIVQA